MPEPQTAVLTVDAAAPVEVQARAAEGSEPAPVAGARNGDATADQSVVAPGADDAFKKAEVGE